MTAPLRRMPAPYDVIRVRPGHPINGHDYSGALLTVASVSDDGSELDATWWTGGPLLHFLASWVSPVSPPRGAA